MAAVNATPFPVYGQAYRIPVCFRDTSGNLITGWTGAACEAYPDNGYGVAQYIAESPANSGYGYIDIAAAQMTCTMCGIVGSISNTNWTAFVAAVQPVHLGQFTGRFDAQTILRFEQMILDIYINAGINGGTTNGAQMLFNNPDGSTHFSSNIVQSQVVGTRIKTQ